MQKLIKFDNVKVTVNGKDLIATGKFGENKISMPDCVAIKLENNEVLLDSEDKCMLGTYTALTKNVIKGVNERFKRDIELVGLGYEVKKENNFLIFSLGYSHPVKFEIIADIECVYNSKTSLTFYCRDKNLLGINVAKLVALRKFNCYTGSGIKIVGYTYVRKAVKKGVK